jgi:F0F1-type ATP synthase assembly protein I
MSRHDLDLTSLVSGIVFVGVGIVFLLDLSADYSVSPRWVIPLVLIGIGLAGLLSTANAGRRGTRGSSPSGGFDDEPVEP